MFTFWFSLQTRWTNHHCNSCVTAGRFELLDPAYHLSKIRTRGVFRVGLLAYKMVEFGKTLFCSSHPPLPLFIQSTRHLCQELWPTPDSPMSLVPGRPQAPMPRWNEPPDSPKSLVTNTLNKG